MVINLKKFTLKRYLGKFNSWSKPKKKFLYIIPFSGIFIGVVILYFYITTPQPAINLQIPQPDTTNLEKSLYVRGIVKPAGSTIKVNGKLADTDGDGKFTVFVSIPTGKSVLRVDAVYFGKHSSFIEPISRQLSMEEKQELAQKQQQEADAAKQRVLGTDSKITDLLDQSKDGDIVHIVNVVSHNAKKDSIYTRVIGEVINSTLKPVYWVKVTAKFFDISDQIIDTKEGFAVSSSESLAPNATHQFTTQATDKPYVYYKLAVDWRYDEYTSTTSAEFAGSDLNASSSSLLTPLSITPAPNQR